MHPWCDSSYTPGHTIRASNDEDCKPEKLRLALADALTTGSMLLIDMDGDDDVDGDGDAPTFCPCVVPASFRRALHRPRCDSPPGDLWAAHRRCVELRQRWQKCSGAPRFNQGKITKAYRKLARKNHWTARADTFIRINTAFEVLTGAALPPMNDDVNDEPVTPNVNFKVMILRAALVRPQRTYGSTARC